MYAVFMKSFRLKRNISKNDLSVMLLNNVWNWRVPIVSLYKSYRSFSFLKCSYNCTHCSSALLEALRVSTVSVRRLFVITHRARLNDVNRSSFFLPVWSLCRCLGDISLQCFSCFLEAGGGNLYCFFGGGRRTAVDGYSHFFFFPDFTSLHASPSLSQFDFLKSYFGCPSVNRFLKIFEIFSVIISYHCSLSYTE